MQIIKKPVALLKMWCCQLWKVQYFFNIYVRIWIILKIFLMKYNIYYGARIKYFRVNYD